MTDHDASLRRQIPYGYCHCGCGQKTGLAPDNRPKQGYVKGQPKKWITGHNPKQPARPLEERLAEYIPERPGDGCWVWQGCRITPHGYGCLHYKGRQRAAHRVSYEHFVGPIPEGLELDHLCRNPACVNPTHLEPVTHRENVVRGVGFSGTNVRKTHCKRGHPFDEENTDYVAAGRECRACRPIRRRERTERERAARNG